MNTFQKSAKARAEIMLAFAEGKTIQGLESDGKWVDLCYPSWDWECEEFRIRPEPFAIWVNVHSDGSTFSYPDELGAVTASRNDKSVRTIKMVEAQ